MMNFTMKPMTIVARRAFKGTQDYNKDKWFFVLDVTGELKLENNAYFGYGIKQVFLTRESWDQIKPEDIGKKIDLDWGSDDYGNPVVTSFKLIDYLSQSAK